MEEQLSQKIQNVAKKIFDHPELGYKEFKTKETVVDYITSINPNAEIEYFSTTGVRVRMRKSKELNICFLAELDGLYSPQHWNCDVQTGAAHNCGHYSQVAIGLWLYEYFWTTKAYENLTYDLTFVFVPAEEYVDLDYRYKLREEGVISFLGGKPEAMKLGVFNDIDATIYVHSIGGYFDERTIELNCDLAGFMYKRYTFKGKPTHAGFDPFSGINAYSMSTLFNNAIGLMRQQFKDTEYVRVNPVVMHSDMAINIVPDKIQVGTDIRTRTVDYMKVMSDRLDQAAKGSAMALGGELEMESELGYLPFNQNHYLSSFAFEALEKTPEIKKVLNHNIISAAGDVGDLSMMMPVIQIGYSGFDGTIHGIDFKQVDPDMIYLYFPKFLVAYFEALSKGIEKDKLYKRSFEDYMEIINQF